MAEQEAKDYYFKSGMDKAKEGAGSSDMSGITNHPSEGEKEAAHEGYKAQKQAEATGKEVNKESE